MLAEAPTERRSGDILLLAFMATVVMLFAGFTTALLIRRSGPTGRRSNCPRWCGPIPACWSSPACCSRSLAASAARPSSARGSRPESVLGRADRRLEPTGRSGLGIGANAHGSFFYVFSAIHALHLLGGLGATLYVLLRGRNWRATAVYWHFLGLMWIYVLYLLHAA